MGERDSVSGGLTRCQYVRRGGTMAENGLIAGCLDGSDATEPSDSDGQYAVESSTIGSVEFDAVPDDEQRFDRDSVPERIRGEL